MLSASKWQPALVREETSIPILVGEETVVVFRAQPADSGRFAE